MLASFETLHGWLIVVSAILGTSGGNAHCVNGLGGEHLIDVIVRLDPVLLCNRVNTLREYITQRDEIGVFILAIPVRVDLAYVAHAYDGYLKHCLSLL